ncbi:hypothetical protein B0T14DRAFT_426521 [Immersiella caudata]|uniref:Non-canonical purine NTP phosphatase/PRRC1 domain-containing protein n=1 Tax=Immersiella caudata TaxID=314043 RepID=A0AA39WVH5_9PEZI|nr:hypothetical protein B0T14DRAFT_426521 [Immersiella caudata]
MTDLTTPTLTKPIQALQNTEKVIPKPSPNPPTSIRPISHPTFRPHGTNTLVLIPTANRHKTRILTQAFERQKPHSVQLHVLVLPAESNVGEQPYDEAGIEGARNRIENALQALDERVLAEKGVGRVMVASIENFIQRPGAAGEDPVDYGLVMVYNATKRTVVWDVSRGVTVPRGYYEVARGFGTEGGIHGTVTVGEVIAANVEGVDRADWHVAVAGVSRYELLEEAVYGIEMPW